MGLGIWNYKWDLVLKCGARVFKFDFIAGEDVIDARPLQVDEFCLQRLLDSGTLSEENAKSCQELLSLNRDLTGRAEYPPYLDTMILAPFSKTFRDLERLSGRALERDEIEVARRDKFKFYRWYEAFAMAAIAGAARETAEELHEKHPYLSAFMKAGLTVADFYLYSQNLVPLAASTVAAYTAERYGSSSLTTTALKYGVSSLVRYALDPGATISDTIALSAYAYGGGLAGAFAVKTAPMLFDACKTAFQSCRRRVTGYTEAVPDPDVAPRPGTAALEEEEQERLL